MSEEAVEIRCPRGTHLGTTDQANVVKPVVLKRCQTHCSPPENPLGICDAAIDDFGVRGTVYLINSDPVLQGATARIDPPPTA